MGIRAWRQKSDLLLVAENAGAQSCNAAAVVAVAMADAEAPPPAAEPAAEPEGDGAAADAASVPPALLPTPPATPKQQPAGSDEENPSEGKEAEESPARPPAKDRAKTKEEDVVDEVQANSKEKKKIMLLRNVPFCKDLPEDVLLELAESMQRVTVRAQLSPRQLLRARPCSDCTPFRECRSTCAVRQSSLRESKATPCTSSSRDSWRSVTLCASSN